MNKSNKLKVRTPVYCPYSPTACHPCHNDTLLSRNRFEPLRSLHPNSKHIDDVKLNIKEPISKQIKDKPRETSPLIVMQPIPPSHTLDGIIAHHAIDENPYWLKLHQAMSIPHSDLPFPNIKIGAFNPNGVLPVTRTDHNNSTYSLNKPQVIFDKAKELNLSILGLSETHHTRFPPILTFGNSPPLILTPLMKGRL